MAKESRHTAPIAKRYLPKKKKGKVSTTSATTQEVVTMSRGSLTFKYIENDNNRNNVKFRLIDVPFSMPMVLAQLPLSNKDKQEAYNALCAKFKVPAKPLGRHSYCSARQCPAVATRRCPGCGAKVFGRCILCDGTDNKE